MTFRSRREPEKPPEHLRQLVIPDELLAWGSEAANVVRFNADWASEVRALLPADGRALTSSETEKLLSRLDGLCREAIKHERVELLFEMDTYLTEWLGLRYIIPTRFGKLEVSRTGPWYYSELRVLVDVKEAEAIAAAFRVKELFSEVFPEAVIGEVFHEETRSTTSCAVCYRRDMVVTMETDAATYCKKCWQKIAGK